LIPSDVLAEMATLGLSREQAERVASMLARVEKATEARSNDAIEARRANERLRSARYRSNGGGEIPADLREAVFQRDGFACVYCGCEDYLQCDHVVPVSKGGETSLDNLATACRVCNAKKKDRDRKAFERSLSKEVRGQSEVPRTENPPSPPPPKNTNQTPSTPSPETTKRAKRRTAMVQDTQPSKDDVRAAVADGLSMDEIRSEWRAFRDFHIAKGNVMADWPAAWRTWLRNRKRFGKPQAAGPRPGRPSIQDRFANLIQDEPEDHEPACYEGHTIDGSLSTDGDDPRGRYALAGSAEPFGADTGWPLASPGYAARNG